MSHALVGKTPSPLLLAIGGACACAARAPADGAAKLLEQIAPRLIEPTAILGKPPAQLGLFTLD